MILKKKKIEIFNIETIRNKKKIINLMHIIHYHHQHRHYVGMNKILYNLTKSVLRFEILE